MSNLPESPAWESGIHQLEEADRAKAGPGGVLNIQATQLANRTQYLRSELDAYNGLLKSGEIPFSSEDDAQLAISAGKISEGGFFSIRSEDPDIWVDEYRNVSGVVVPTGKSLPSLMYLINQLKAIVDIGASMQLEGFPDVAWAWLDKLGKSTVETLSDGTTNLAALLLGEKIEFVTDDNSGIICQLRGGTTPLFSLSASGAVTFGDVVTWLSDEEFFAGMKRAWMDAEGKIYKVEYPDGSIADYTSDTGSGDSDSAQYPAVVSINGNIVSVDKNTITQITSDTGVSNIGPVAHKDFTRFISDMSGSYLVHRATHDGKYRARESLGLLIHGICVGQSLSPGGSTVSQEPVTTTAQADYGILAFATGPKVDFRYQTLDPELLESVIPCRENTGVRPGQESPASGMAWQIHELTGHTVLVSTAGSSGTDIAGISAGTAAFQGATAMIQAGAAMAEKLGLEYMPILVLIHGNANAAAGTSMASYQSSMESLRLSYQSVIRTAMKDDDYSLHMFLGQLSNIIPYGGTAGVSRENRIGIAQYQQARDNEYTHIASAQYARPYSDGEHLTSSGYRTEGEVIGAVIGNWLNDNSYTALMPDESAVMQSENTLTIPLKGGKESPVTDTARVADPGNLGFVLTGATIASVTLSGKNVVITKTDTTPATRVTYAATGIAGQNPGALTGSRGCIRDSQSGNSLSGLPIYNDLCVFAIDL
ncbi:hypothetical protein [Klebsiella pneumoniae]|uniref:hypothetical protein n=1 Tax=Klebsiella pneumoniae TaxID=573 RepID=UPI001C7F9FDB|nr:hypothetical protein [Klebsiella pneumoniae]MBX4727165.1 hypothetical protein [Klebsiella pneumoniae]